MVFGFLAVLTSWMSSKRRRAEEELKQARDELEMRVQERTKELRQANETLRERANLLDLTHDTVFVRDMNNVITFWNQAPKSDTAGNVRRRSGKVSHEIYEQFPAPLPDIKAELTRTGRWEGNCFIRDAMA